VLAVEPQVNSFLERPKHSRFAMQHEQLVQPRRAGTLGFSTKL